MTLRARIVVVAVIALPSFGCRSMGNTKWSSAVPRGNARTTLGLSIEHAQPEARDFTTPNMLIEWRTGVSEDWDLGFRLRAIDATAGVRRQLVRHDDVELSAGLGATVGAPLGSLKIKTRGFSTALEAPLRIGINVSSKSQLAFGAVPKLRFTREIRDYGSLFAAGTPTFVKSGFSYSAELIAAFDIGFSSKVHLVPWISAEVFYGDSSFVWVTDTVLYRAGIDVNF